MKSKVLSITLMVLVASMIMANPGAFADVELESLVNLATQARAQIKLQLDRTQDVSQDVRDLFAQGDAQTNLLIEAASKNDATAAKSHFMSAMKIFRQITQTFSEPAPAASQAPSTDMQSLSTPVTATAAEYRNDLLRTERYVNTLRNSVEKSNLAVDFAKADELIRKAKENLASGNLAEVDRLLGELKNVQNEIRAAIKEQTLQQSNARVRAFVEDYIAKIDAILSQADELGLSEGDVAKLAKIKQELESTKDANQLIIKIKHYSVSISVDDYKSQRIQSEVSRLEARLNQLERSVDDTIKPKFEDARSLITRIKNQTMAEDPLRVIAFLDSTIQEIEKYVQAQTARQERQQTAQERQQTTQDSKKARLLAEVARLQEKLERLEPHIDQSLKSKFDTAESLLNKIRDQAENDDPTFSRTAKALDLLIGQIENLIKMQERNSASEQTPKQNRELVQRQ